MITARTLFSCLTLALIALAPGCASNKSEFGDRTAVMIRNRTPKEIIDSTIVVFQEKGFQVKISTKTEAIFERKGSEWQAATWGGWSGTGVWERATVRLSDYGAGAYLLEANVEIIGDKGDAFMEDSRPLPRRARKPYQEMLNDVQGRLQGPPA
jgi:hypothetical protein